ncbi:MAG TPA: adenosylcobinamide-GDP ribazoletransferase [Rectinemataceae bacterium]|nr:adenosylcobinamide-GDP ribazoletransferase [Rectinemataceae bacterium]
MRVCLRRFLSVFSLVSRIPVRTAFECDYARADFWLPIVGVFASAAALAGYGLASLVFASPLLRGLGALFVQYSAFNLFHLDGLLDSADAMTPYASRERRHEILKDPRIGSYALFYGFFALAAKLAALASLGPPAILALFLAYPAAGRLGAALLPALIGPAREGGLGALMRGLSPLRSALGFALALMPLLAWSAASGAGRTGLAAAACAIAGAAIGALWMALLYRRKLGGFTGDALGAAVELGELACVLLFAALA